MVPHGFEKTGDAGHGGVMAPGECPGWFIRGEKAGNWLVSAVEKGAALVPVREERFLPFVEDIFRCVRISVKRGAAVMRSRD